MEKTAQPRAEDRLPLVYETAHYKVVLGRIDLPETPLPMQRKYIIVHAEDGVILGLAGSRAGAIAGAMQAEAELTKIEEMIAEEAARKGTTDAFVGDSPFG